MKELYDELNALRETHRRRMNKHGDAVEIMMRDGVYWDQIASRADRAAAEEAMFTLMNDVLEIVTKHLKDHGYLD